MPEALQPMKQLDGLEQAVYFHSRERRRSLQGIPELYRNQRLAGPTMSALIPVGSFPLPASPITFQTAIGITGAASGQVFAFGDATTAVSLFVTANTIVFRAGDATAGNFASAIFDNGGPLPVGLELDLVASVRPGDGRVRLWGNGREIARGQATNETMPNGFAADSVGNFAQAAIGGLPADVTATGAPAGFTVLDPLSVYQKQFPRHFV